MESYNSWLCVWLLSLKHNILRFIHIVLSLLFMAEKYSIGCICHNLSIDGHWTVSSNFLFAHNNILQTFFQVNTCRRTLFSFFFAQVFFLKKPLITHHFTYLHILVCISKTKNTFLSNHDAIITQLLMIKNTDFYA